MQKSILISSFKIVLAAIGAIMVARLFHLEFAISAGIVAILTIQPTKRETVNTALGRLYAFVVALVVAFISFRILGGHFDGIFCIFSNLYLPLSNM